MDDIWKAISIILPVLGLIVIGMRLGYWRNRVMSEQKRLEGNLDTMKEDVVELQIDSKTSTRDIGEIKVILARFGGDLKWLVEDRKRRNGVGN